MVEKIIKVISNLKILSKMNEIIDGLNTHTANTNNPHNVTAEQLGLATAYVYKGSVTNFSDLPTNAQNGWVYSVENEYIDSSGNVYPAGSNFAWNGSKWDDLGGSLSGYAKSVNSQTPDSKGNVFLNLVQSLEKNTEDKLVVHNSDGSIQELEVGKNYDNDLNNILDSITELETRVIPIKKGGTGATTASGACKNLGAVQTVNGAAPDSKGNVFLNLVQSLEKNTEDKLVVHNSDGSIQELEVGKNYNDLNNILDSITELENRVIPISDVVTEMSDYIIESYRNGTEWYEVYKSGKVRQGGRKPANNTQITFLKPFANTNYCVNIIGIRGSSTNNSYHWVHSLTTTGFTSLIVDEPAPWVADGQGA